MPMSAKQIRFFGTKAQKAALRRKRSSRSTRAKRVSPKRYNMTRRSTKKRSGGRRGKTFHVLDNVAKLNALFQGLEPFIQRGIIAAATAGDFNAVITILREGGKEALSAANILQAAGPIIGLKVIKTLMRTVGAPNPRFGRVALI